MGASLGLPTADELAQLPAAEREKFQGINLANTVKQTLQEAPAARVELLIQGVFNLHTKIDSQSESLTKLSAVVATHEKNCVELRGYVNQLCGKVDSQEKEITALGRKVVSTEQTVHGLSNALTMAQQRIHELSFSTSVSMDKVEQKDIRFDRIVTVPTAQSNLVDTDGAIAASLGLPIASFSTIRRMPMGPQRKAAIIRLKDPMTISQARAHLSTTNPDKSITMRRSLTFMQRILGRFCGKLQGLLPDDRFRFTEWEGQVRVAPRADPRAFCIYPTHLHFPTGSPSVHESEWKGMNQMEVVHVINWLFGPGHPDGPSPSGSPPHKVMRTVAGPSGG